MIVIKRKDSDVVIFSFSGTTPEACALPAMFESCTIGDTLTIKHCEGVCILFEQPELFEALRITDAKNFIGRFV